MKEKDNPKVYTGFIDGEFLGIPAIGDEEDLFTYTKLQDYKIEKFQENNVEVISIPHPTQTTLSQMELICTLPRIIIFLYKH